jgi:plasmid stabilization system protein ParE
VTTRSHRLRRTSQAEEDLIDIWAYIGRNNPRAADRLLDLLHEKSLSLARDPHLGMARDDIGAGFGTFRLENTSFFIGLRPTASRLSATFMACVNWRI